MQRMQPAYRPLTCAGLPPQWHMKNGPPTKPPTSSAALGLGCTLNWRSTRWSRLWHAAFSQRHASLLQPHICVPQGSSSTGHKNSKHHKPHQTAMPGAQLNACGVPRSPGSGSLWLQQPVRPSAASLLWHSISPAVLQLSASCIVLSPQGVQHSTCGLPKGSPHHHHES